MNYEDGKEKADGAAVTSRANTGPGGTGESNSVSQSDSAKSNNDPLELPALTRAVLLVYGLFWYGLLLAGLAVTAFAQPAWQSWLVPLLLMAPIIVRAWFSPLRLREALFHAGWRGFGLSALEGVALSALLPLWLWGTIAIAKTNPGLAKYLVGGEPTKDWPNFLAGMAAVAIGEELFFRAFLQHEFSLALTDRRRLGCERLGRGWLLAGILFGVAHVFDQGGAGLLTFFPALAFGWLYARRNQFIGPAIFHFACNILVAVATAASWLAAPPPEAPAPPVIPAAAVIQSALPAALPDPR